MRRRDWLGLVGCGLSFSAVARAAHGLRPLAVGELLAASVAVCSVTVALVGARWVEVFGRRRIVTKWRTNVERVLSGDLSDTTELTTLGGVVGDVQQWVPHEARLIDGRSHLVFVMPGPGGSLWVTGMMQGAYLLESNRRGPSVVLSVEQSEVAQQPASACAHFDGLSIEGIEQLLSTLVKS